MDLMVPYQSFEQGVEIKGKTVLAVVEEAMGKFSETYRDRFNRTAPPKP